MRKIILDISNGSSLSFEGNLISSTMSSPHSANECFSGQVGIHNRISLFQSQMKKYICYDETFTQLKGDQDLKVAEICEDVAGIVKFFGHSWLAQELYYRSRKTINNILEVERTL